VVVAAAALLVAAAEELRVIRAGVVLEGPEPAVQRGITDKVVSKGEEVWNEIESWIGF